MAGGWDQAAVEAALAQIPGVAAAWVQADADGGLGALRVELEPGVDEVAVARAVGGLLRQQFGLSVDADKVQVVDEAQRALASAVAPVRSLVAGERPLLDRWVVTTSGLDVTAEVTLRHGWRVASGSAPTAATATGSLRAVTAALLRAVEELVSPHVRIDLEHVSLVATGPDDQSVIVVVGWVDGRRIERLSGAATVRGDPVRSALHGALAALNRRLGPLLEQRQADLVT
jgi:hypothetical protein